MEADKIFKQIFSAAKQDSNVLGFIITGSRAKGFATKYSDYDGYLIVKKGLGGHYHKKYPFNTKNEDIDIKIMDIYEFEKYAYMSGPREWARYDFAHIKAQIDKTNGRIQKLIDEKSKIPKNRLRKYISGFLDGYINFVYRSLKCSRNGNYEGLRLEAAREIPLFINVLFALDGRVSPCCGYLKWELTNYPIRQFPISAKGILDSIMEILDTGDPKTQQKLLLVSEKVFRKKGYGKVFDKWTREKIRWMETAKV